MNQETMPAIAEEIETALNDALYTVLEKALDYNEVARVKDALRHALIYFDVDKVFSAVSHGKNL